MKHIKRIAAAFLCFACAAAVTGTAKSAKLQPTKSVYTQAPKDQQAVYFSSASEDITVSLQKAINDLKEKDDMGIIFIPEGKYTVSATIYVPKGIRLIGYGKTRPVITLAKNAPGFSQEYPDDKGKAKYVFWFTNSLVKDENHISDAGSGTFYSAFTNIDAAIAEGNSNAVFFRTHYAQHSFISHCRISIGSGKAGIFDVGNEIEDVEFIGGEVGIYTTRTSPSWQFTMVNTRFEGQRRAAILTEEGGFVIKRMTVKNAPVAIELYPDRSDKIFMEDCTFENLSDCGILESRENYSPNQLSMLNVTCSKVPVAVRFRDTGRSVAAPSQNYVVKRLTNGLSIDSMGAKPEMRLDADIQPLQAMPAAPADDILPLPDVSTWANVLDLGLVGDAKTDNTEALKKAIATHDILYFPQGWYKVTENIKLGKNTVLIGLNPITTQIFIDDSTPAFTGFGGPVAILETPQGGENIINGIGMSTGAFNYRAVAIKWQSGAHSMMNDVKFLGVHGSTVPGSHEYVGVFRIPNGVSRLDKPLFAYGKDMAWDNQHWSLWITNGGGGTFKDLWSANTFATSGIYVSDTDTPATMYEISIEHHVRNEIRFKNVHNWNVYALQLEEEVRESPDVQQIELQECSNMKFADLYLFRVIWVDTPLPVSVRTWSSKDIEVYNCHNFTQMRYTPDVTFEDVNTKQKVLPWEFTYLKITGNEPNLTRADESGITKLAGGFEYIEGAAIDSKGNVYFSEQRLRRIYKWNPQTKALTLVTDMPWAISSLATDTQDNLLMLVKYKPQPGSDEPKVNELPDRAGSTYSYWGNNGFETRVAAMDPARPEETLRVIDRTPMSSVKNIAAAYYPSHRWRDLNDFDEVSLYTPEYCFVAPDGVTVIPQYYDILRSSSMIKGTPGSTIYSTDEYNHRVVSLKVGQDGTLSDMKEWSTMGEFNAIPGPDGKVLVAEGLVYVYNADGTLDTTIEFPERPTSMVMSKDRILYVAARSGFYQYRF